MPPLRFDAKTVLGMFNASRLATMESEQKDKMAEINRNLEERKMADEQTYRQGQLGIANRAADEARLRGDQAAAWHEGDTQERHARDLITDERYKAQSENERLHTAATDRFNQGMLGYYNRMAQIAENKQLGADGKPLTDSQMKAKLRADFQTKKGELARDLNTAMQGFNFNTKPQDSFSKGPDATKQEMQRSLGVYNNVMSTLQKYDESDFPATALNQTLVAKIRQRLTDSQDWMKTIHGYQSDPNASATDATGLYPGAANVGVAVGGFKDPVSVVPQNEKDALFNQWSDVNARLSQYDQSGLSQAGFVTDPATGRQYKVGF